MVIFSHLEGISNVALLLSLIVRFTLFYRSRNGHLFFVKYNKNNAIFSFIQAFQIPNTTWIIYPLLF